DVEAVRRFRRFGGRQLFCNPCVDGGAVEVTDFELEVRERYLVIASRWAPATRALFVDRALKQRPGSLEVAEQAFGPRQPIDEVCMHAPQRRDSLDVRDGLRVHL